MLPTEDSYEMVMRDARENVFLVAARRTIDTRLLAVEFDAGSVSGQHEEHTLTISVRDAPIAVTADAIPHEWLPANTDFIDTRFSRLVGGLLAELVRKAQEKGLFL
jgi:hypothetical protein